MTVSLLLVETTSGTRAVATFANRMDSEANVLRPIDGRTVELLLLDAEGNRIPHASAPREGLGRLRDSELLLLHPGGTLASELPSVIDLAGAARVTMREASPLPEDGTTRPFCRGLAAAHADAPLP